jgi:predicted DNA-binding protein
MMAARLPVELDQRVARLVRLTHCLDFASRDQPLHLAPAKVFLRIKPVIESKLARKAKRADRSRPALARAASVSWLYEQENIRIAEERFARLEAGQSRTYPLAEVKRELGRSV